MARQLLLSVLVAWVVIPVVLSRGHAGPRALRKTLLFTVAFNLLYAFGALVVYPQLNVP
jgi:hypothetical protein